MATRRSFHALILRSFLLSTTPSVHRPLQTIHHFHTSPHCDFLFFKPPHLNILYFPSSIYSIRDTQFSCFRNFSSDTEVDDFDYLGADEIYGDVDDEEEEYGAYEDEEEEVPQLSKYEKRDAKKTMKVRHASDLGYVNLGRLDMAERPFKMYEPYFAVVKIGPHQFKVSNGDVLFAERLNACDVMDKIMLTKVLMVGSKNQTIIGRPFVNYATVYAVVEEQRLTRLRILDVQGIEKTTKPRFLPRSPYVLYLQKTLGDKLKEKLPGNTR